MKRAIASRGGSLKQEIYYDTKKKDFSPEIKKLVKLPMRRNYKVGEKGAPKPRINFKALFIPDSPQRVGMLAALLAYYDVIGVDLLGTNLWHNQKLIDSSARYLASAIFPDAFDPESKSESTASFVTSFQAAMGSKPNVIDAHGYDAAVMLRSIITSTSPPRTRVALRRELSQLQNVKGVCGLLSMGADRRVRKELTLLSVRDGRFVTFDRNDQPQQKASVRKSAPAAWSQPKN
jgi:hypothetical protein